MKAMWAGAVVLALVAEAGLAQSVSSRNRTSLFKSQTNVLDTRASKQYSNSIRLQPPKVVTPTKWQTVTATAESEVPIYKGKYRGPLVELAKDAARRNGIPEDLFLRLVQQESGWNPKARSPKGAYGLAQLMPGTARGLGVNSKDPAENLEGGARYLRTQYKAFGSWPLALAAYNAGPGAVKKYNGIPPFKETRNYVKIIWGG